MRWLWLKRTDDHRSWFQLPAEVEGKVESMFQASIYIELGDGGKALFWSDRWLQGKSLIDLAPCLVDVACGRVKKKRTVAQALQNRQWISDITGALTVQVLLEYLQVWDRLQGVRLQENQPDKICWKWTSDKMFSTSSAYLAFFIGQHPIEGARILRKTRAPAKCKFFIWLVLHERCWTVARRKKHGLQDDDTCVLCNQSSETIDHLLIACPFSREIWFNVLRKVGWESVTPSLHMDHLASWWTEARKHVPKPNRRGFDSLVVLICWQLWKERNDRTFDRRVRTIEQVIDRIVDEIAAWSLAGFRHLETVSPITVTAIGRDLMPV